MAYPSPLCALDGDLTAVCSEHQEEDDRNLEKVHVDATKGVYRTRRRDRGVGFEDDDSDDDEVRRPRPKRVRIDNGDIVALGRCRSTFGESIHIGVVALTSFQRRTRKHKHSPTSTTRTCTTMRMNSRT